MDNVSKIGYLAHFYQYQLVDYMLLQTGSFLNSQMFYQKISKIRSIQSTISRKWSLPLFH